jgi:hypothetical protein
LAFNDCKTASPVHTFNYTENADHRFAEETLLFEMYPNPSGGEVTINCSNQSVPYDLLVTSIQGIQILRKRMASESCKLHLNKGTYLIQVKSEQKSEIKKLIVLNGY